MNVQKFNEVVETQLKRSTDVLCNKAKEYATEDRLHNFKIAATLQGISTKQALAGMLAKHTVSIYDLCMSTKPVSLEMWEEKITDHINYLLLLRAVIEEDVVTLYADDKEVEKYLGESIAYCNAKMGADYGFDPSTKGEEIK